MAVLRRRPTSLISALVSVVVLVAGSILASEARAEAVNYDDPNLVFRADYASDNAASCPKTLKGKKLRACLIKNGLAPAEEISADAEILSEGPGSSFH